MTKETLPTETFLPHDHEQAAVKDTPGALSTRGRLLAYNQQLKDSLHHGLQFTELIDQLINTQSSKQLLAAALELTQYQLDSAYLVFPQQYNCSDFYLMFINRLLELNDLPAAQLLSADTKQELYHQFAGLDASGYFVFQTDNTPKDGAYYYERKHAQQLFYLNFKHNVLRFNNEALTDLLVVEYAKQFDYSVIKRFANFLVAVGQCLKKDFGFDVDFGLLDSANTAAYALREQTEPKEALDRLFIAAANAGYMLVAGEHNEAILKLQDDVVVKVYDRHAFAADKTGWALKVTDPHHQVAWFDVLFKYDFLRDWYLENRSALALSSDPVYFA